MDTARMATAVAAIAQQARVTNQVAFSLDHMGEAGERPVVTVTAARWLDYADRERLLRRVAAAIDPGMVVDLDAHHGRSWITGHTVVGGVTYHVTAPLSEPGGES